MKGYYILLEFFLCFKGRPWWSPRGPRVR